MNKFYSALVVLAGLGCGAAQAAGQQGLALARAKACMACHQVDARRVGPPLGEVAARYGAASGSGESATAAPDETTVAYLAKSIREGGRGRWGAIPMPAQPHVTPAEATELARWVLSLQRESQPGG